MTRTMAARCTALLAASALALTGCANPIDTVTAAVSSPTVAEGLAARAASVTTSLTAPTLLEDGTLTVGLSTSASAPMCVTGSDGSYQGYDVDIAYALGAQLGLKVKFVSVSNAASACGVECDVVMDSIASRSGGATVVGSYAEDSTAFFYKGEEKVCERGELLGKNFGVQDGSASMQVLKRSDLDAAITTFENLNDAFDALEQGTVDYVLCDANSGAYLSGEYGDLSCAGTISTPESIGVAVASTNTELQNYVKEAVDAISSNGVADLIRAKWLGGMSPLTDASIVSNIQISAGTVEGASDTAEVSGGSSGVQDGSTAGANAATIAE